MTDPTPAPDWARLGARLGVSDVCVPFANPGTLYAKRTSGFETIAERVVALRESPEGVSVQVECGLFLFLDGARLESVSEDGADAYVQAEPPTVRVPVRDGRHRRERETPPDRDYASER